MSKFLSWLAVLVFSLLLIGGTFFLTKTLFVASVSPQSSVSEKNVPEIVYSVSPTTLSAEKGDYAYLNCDNWGNNEKQISQEKCSLKSGASDWMYPLPEIKDIKGIKSEVNTGGEYDRTSPFRLGSYLYAVLSYPTSLITSVRRIYGIDTSGNDFTPKVVFDCDSLNCIEIQNKGYNNISYIVKENESGTSTRLFLVTIDKSQTIKSPLATVTLNGWKLGTVCTGDPCINGQHWGKEIDSNNILLFFQKAPDSIGSANESSVETKYQILELQGK